MAEEPAPVSIKDARPAGQRRLLERAYQLTADIMGLATVDDVVEGKCEVPEPHEVDAWSPTKVLGVALCLTLREFLPIVYPSWPKPSTCGWCIRAAGNTQEAANAAPLMGPDEISEHTLKCPFNPLVIRLGVIERLAEDASGPDRWALAMWRATSAEAARLKAEIVDVRTRYAAALPAAARVSSEMRAARDTLEHDREEYGTENTEAAEFVRLWGDVADAFDAAHGGPA